MIFTFIILVIYVAVFLYFAFQTKRFKDFLESQNATNPNQAVLLNEAGEKAFITVAAKFDFSALKYTTDGRYWVNLSQWKPMVVGAGIVFFISVLSLIFVVLGSF